MTEAFDTTGTKINPIARMIEAEKRVNGEKPTAPAFTSKELAELKARDERRAQIAADAPYLGWPAKTPMFTHENPAVNDVAKMLWELGI